MPVDNSHTDTLFADTVAIRTLGRAYASHRADLDTVISTLGAIPAPAFGPVGARFLTAFADAVADHSAAVAALGEATTASAVLARHSADAYDAAGDRAGKLLPRV